MAECGAVIPPAVGVVSGYDPRTGLRYVNQVFLGFTGGAGSPHADAWLTIAHVGNAGMSCIDGIELDELYHPIVVERRELIPDTEGAGTHVGAHSILVEFGPTISQLEIGYVSDGHHNPPLGARGGLPGGGSAQGIRRRDGREEPLAACAQVSLAAGEMILSVSTGGGGYGPPEQRAPEAVAKSVRAGLVSPARAREVYRVALERDGVVDWPATERLRGKVSG